MQLKCKVLNQEKGPESGEEEEEQAGTNTVTKGSGDNTIALLFSVLAIGPCKQL